MFVTPISENEVYAELHYTTLTSGTGIHKMGKITSFTKHTHASDYHCQITLNTLTCKERESTGSAKAGIC